jgi:hypothetical protein
MQRTYMNNVLAIYDKESAYTGGLLDYIQKNIKLGLKVHAFTNSDSLNEYVKNHVITVLLVNESVDLGEIDHSNIKNICILWEGEKEDVNTAYPIIYKFQSAKGIMEQLFLKYPKELFLNQEGNKNSSLHIISVCSLDRKKKQSILAYSLAREYSKHKKVLYINLHSWQVLSKLLSLKEYNGISETIYYLRQKSPNFILKMNNIVVKVEGLDCIYGTSFGLEVDELTKEDTLLWIEQLHMWNQYEIIVFDVGNIHLGTLELLQQSSDIIYTLKKNSEDDVELDVFRQQLEFAGYKDIVEKMRLCDISREKEECILELLH